MNFHQIFCENACLFRLTPPTRRGRFSRKVWLRWPEDHRQEAWHPAPLFSFQAANIVHSAGHGAICTDGSTSLWKSNFETRKMVQECIWP